MTVTLLITHLNDPRVEDAVASVLAQGEAVEDILIADGGSAKPVRDMLLRIQNQNPKVRVLNLPGSVAETRNASLPHVRGEFLVFLDADQRAPPGWAERLTAPLRADEADFAGGPTRPLRRGSFWSAQSYVDAEEARLYARHVPRDLALLPMGNSAWRTHLLRRIGGFDSRLGVGGEDYDVNLRALRAGAKGVFLPEAWVYHDQSHLDSYRKVIRRKYRYYVGAGVAYLKNDAMRDRRRSALRRLGVHHPLDLLDLVLKPMALMRARARHRQAFGPSRSPPEP